jgi:hypothetical protein
MNDQLYIQFEAPVKRSMPTERTRDSEGRYASDLCETATDPIESLKNENEMLTRKYLAIAKQLASTERELLKYKNV